MSRNVCVASVLALVSACTFAEDESTDLASAGFALSASPLELEGYLTDAFGGALANRCAHDVQGAFERIPAAPTGRIRYRSMGGRVLPPANARLADFGDWDSHVQSFARLSLPWADNLWAAVSRSNPGTNGGAGIFLVDLAGVGGDDGARWVSPGDDFNGEPPASRSTSLYYPISATGHPGGMQSVGDFLVVALEGLEGQPPFADIFQRAPADVAYTHLQRLTLHGDLGEPTAPTRFITATAMGRLRDGRYLLFVLGKDEDQQGWFYLSDQARLTPTTTWTFLDEVAMPWLYQNVAMVTECNTGDVYLIATNNVDYDGSPSSGTEYADLMQVNLDGATGQLDTPLINVRAFGAGGSGFCTFRAAANVFIDRDGELLLYCHAYKANTDLFGRPDSKLKLVEYAPP